MILEFDAQNVSPGRVPFAFICVLQNVPPEYASYKDKIAWRWASATAYEPGERVKFVLEWPFTSFRPIDVGWKARPDVARKWRLFMATFGEEKESLFAKESPTEGVLFW